MRVLAISPQISAPQDADAVDFALWCDSGPILLNVPSQGNYS